MIIPEAIIKAIKEQKGSAVNYHEPDLTFLVVALCEYHNLVENLKYRPHRLVTAEDIAKIVIHAQNFSFG